MKTKKIFLMVTLGQMKHDFSIISKNWPMIKFGEKQLGSSTISVKSIRKMALVHEFKRLSSMNK